MGYPCRFCRHFISCCILINTLFDKIKSVFLPVKEAVRIEIIQIVGLGLVATFLAAVLNQHKSSITSLFIVFVGSVMFLILIDQIHSILQMIERVASEAKVSNVYVETLLKIIELLILPSLELKLQKMLVKVPSLRKLNLLGKS